MTVLITGAGGQLGLATARHFQTRARVVACDRKRLDLTDSDAVRRLVGEVRPDTIINCAAHNDVDGAEDRPEPALAVNAWAVRTLARAAAEAGATLVHYSTDFVFDGAARPGPYREEDPPNPRGTYAASKLMGEWFAAAVPRHFILRVESLFGGSLARSSVDRILDNVLAGRLVRAFADRTVSPSYVEDVAAATAALLDSAAPTGLYHCVNSGWTDWHSLARHLAELVGCPDAAIVATRLADAGLRTPRPQFAALTNDKLRRIGVRMPSWQDAVARYVAARPLAIASAARPVN